eukprot:UN21848
MFGCQNESKMASEISKNIFEVKKSNFLFDSINVSGMYCNLSNTFKRVIFRFLKL